MSFFLNTLDVSAALLRESCKAEIGGASSGKASSGVESRGDHNRTNSEILNEIRSHFNSFPI